MEDLVDRYAPASLGWPGPVQAGQDSPAIRISSSRQLQMVRQARQVGRPKVSRTGQASEARQMEFASSQPLHAELQRIICKFLTTRGSVRLTPANPI